MNTDTRSPLVSVMIPTYNQKDYLATAIESALAQTYPAIEIIVSDDASPDPAVAELLERYAAIPKVKVYRNATNLGRVANYRTTLYERTRGEWVVNLDGDDYFADTQFIQKAISFAKANPPLVMISGQCVELMADGGIVPHKENSGPSRVFSSMAAYDAMYTEHYFPFHGSTLYRRTIAKAVGFYTSDTIMSDVYSLLKLMQIGDVGIIDSKAVVHRVHGSNASLNLGIADWIDNVGVFFAPLASIGTVTSQIPIDLLQRWTRRYAYREGRSIAYKILKRHKSNKGYFAYLLAMSKHSKRVAAKIFIQPKNIIKIFANIFG